MSSDKTILPTDRSINASDCRKLLNAIKRGEVDEFALKNEINAQWRCGVAYQRELGKTSRDTRATLIRALKARLDALEAAP